MLEIRMIADGTTIPLFDLPGTLGRSAAAREIGDTIEGLIAFMDDLGGDPDLETNGDELDGNQSEDDFMYHGGWGVGCPLADPAEVDDEPEDGHDREEVDEREPEEAVVCHHYGIDQTEPLDKRHGQRVPIDALN